MSLDTYDNLLVDIADWLDRSDLTTRIPTFVSLAETRLNRQLRVYWKTKYSLFNVAIAEVDLPLPDGFLGVRTLMAQTVPPRPLRYLSSESANEGNLLADLGGRPSFFTIIADRLRVVPAPSVDLVLEMVYYFRDQFLSSTNQTNLLLANVPDAMLYGALVEAKPFLKDDQRLATWVTMYDQAINNAIEEDKNFRWGDSVVVMTSAYDSNPSGTRVSTG